MNFTELLSELRAAGDPLHLMAAEALMDLRTTAQRLQERVLQLEAVARLNGETIRNMQRASAAADRERYPFHRSPGSSSDAQPSSDAGGGGASLAYSCEHGRRTPCSSRRLDRIDVAAERTAVDEYVLTLPPAIH